MRDWSRHVFIWPATLVVLLVTLFPLVYTLDLSFQNSRLVPPLPPKYIGLGNYTKLFGQERFWSVIGNTSIFVFVSVTLQYVLGFAIALALHRSNSNPRNQTRTSRKCGGRPPGCCKCSGKCFRATGTAYPFVGSDWSRKSYCSD